MKRSLILILAAPLMLLAMFLVGVAILVLDVVTGVFQITRWIMTGDEK